MSPDEEGTAVPPVEAPPELTPGLAEEERAGQPPEAVDEAASVPETGEEAPATPEDALEAFAEQLREAERDHPELADKIFEALPDEYKERLRGPEEERAQLYAEQAQAQWGTIVSETGRRAGAFAPQAVQADVAAWLSPQFEQLRKSVEDFRDGKADEVSIPDVQRLHQSVTSYVNQATRAWYDYSTNLMETSTLQAIVAHPAYAHLSQPDQQKIATASQLPTPEQRNAAYVGIMLDAALGAAPEEVKRTERKKAEKDTGLAKALEGILTALPTNGRKAMGAAASSGAKTYRDMTEEERAKLSSEQIDAMTARFMKQGV